MFRQSPTSRNNRSKGIKSKNILQICLLLAVCFWLIYQVKRSHEKRKEFDENDSKFSLKTESSYVPTMWGRKGLLPRSEEITLPNGKQDKQVEDENPEEDEENKLEEEEEEAEQDQDDKFEEENDEDRGGGDDVVDEHNQEKSDEEIEQEEELVDDEKDRGEVDETDVKNSKENDGHDEDENSQDHELDEDSGSTHEAQEELYKADDASSAVTHDTQTVTTENENKGLEDANENAEVKILEHKSNPDMKISFVQNISLLKLDDHETTGSNSSLNTTSQEESIPEHVSSDSKNTSIVNLTSVLESNNHLEVRNLTEVSGETLNVSLQNLTQSNFDFTIDGNATMNETAGGEDSKLPTTFMQQGNNSVQIVEDTQSDSNLTSIKNEDSNSTSVNATREDGAGDKSDSSGADTSSELEAETSKTVDKTGGIDEKFESSNTENLGEIGQDLIDPSDTSIPLEEKEIDTDLETLPDIQTEGSNTEDVAAE